MNKIVYGSLSFTDAEIVDGEIYQALSLMCDVLEIGTMEVDLYIRDPAVWAALEAFKRNDKLLYYHDDKLRGTYYIESVDRTGKYTFTIKANDAIALLEQSSHFGGIYTGQTVAELVKDICNIPYIVQTRFAEVKMYGWLPIDTRRANLAQVLFAVGASAKVDQQGTLRIEALWNGTASSIGDERVFMGDRVKYETKVTEVSVLEHQYIPSQEEITLFEGTAIQGDIIQFTEPAHGLVANGFSVLESGANWAKVSAGSGELKGKKYTHTTRDVRIEVTPDDVSNVIKVEDATLVSLVNSSAVSERLAGYYRQLQTLQNTIIYGGECPGDVVSITHPFGGESFGCLKSTSIHIGNRPTADTDATIGYRPPAPEITEIYDVRKVVSSDSSFVVPDGVTKMRVALISGGTAGQNGADGEPGNKGGDANCSSGQNGTFYGSFADGGAGGEKGIGGAGGKVNLIDIDVTPGETLNFKVGVGGNPSDDPSGTGSNGTDTTMTIGEKIYTSADGSVSPTGYTDVVTGEVFAASGIDGTDGAMGGRSAGKDSDAEDGENSGENTGGMKSDPNKIQDGTKTGPWIYNGNSTSEDVGRAEETNSNTTGYTGYEYDSEGRFDYTGSQKQIGWVSGGNVDEGVVYTRINNGSVSGSGLSATAQSTMEKHEYKEVQGGYYALRTITKLYSLRKYQRGQAKYTYGHLGAGGGGAAKGANGNNATNDCIGGNGADAASPELPKAIGTGGSGGNGGGGGGGGGCGYASVSGNDNNVAFSVRLSGQNGGKGGLHSKGTRGADGGAILYYGEPKVIKSGPVKDRNGKALLDRLGRRIIV